MRQSPSSHNSAILCEVDIPVYVAVAVWESVPLRLCAAVLCSGAGLVFPIYNQLNPLLSPRLRRKWRVIVIIFTFFKRVQ